MGGKFALYDLRKPRKDKMPFVKPGKAYVGDTLSTFIPRYLAVPVVGTDVNLPARWNRFQENLATSWECIRGDAIYIITVECPIGVALILEASVYMTDLKTKVRGVRWKPHVTPSIAFRVPYESLLSMQHRDYQPPGNSGLNLKITTVEDNSTEEAVAPLNMLVHNAFVNMTMYGWLQIDTDGIDITKSLSFNPMVSQDYNGDVIGLIDEPRYVSWEADVATPVTGEDASVIPLTAAVEDPKLTAQAVKVENVPKVKTKAPVKTSRSPVANLNTKWQHFKDISVGIEEINKIVSVDIMSKDLTAKGENLDKTLKRFIWFSGDLGCDGIPMSLRIRALVTKPVQIAGLLQYQVGERPMQIVYQRIGGDAVEFDIPQFYWTPNNSIGKPSNPREWVMPWIRTKDFRASFKVTVLNANRTSSIKNVQVKLFYKPGPIKFQTPTKPRKPTPRAKLPLTIRPFTNEEVEDDDTFMDTIYDLIDGWSVREFQSDFGGTMTDGNRDDQFYEIPEYLTAVDHIFNEDGTDREVAPSGTQGTESGLMNDDGFEEEDLEQQNFYVELNSVNLKPSGTWSSVGGSGPTVIPLELPLIADRFSNDVGAGKAGFDHNIISELFERYAHIVPTGHGQLGPVIGHYTIQVNAPTNTRARLAHVCLPSDMEDDMMMIRFGLGSIMGLATTAVSTIGGMLKSGAVSSILKGAGDVVSSILGGSTAGEAVSEIVGPLHLDRIVQFVKNVGMAGILGSSPWPKLILQLLDSENLPDKGISIHPGISMDCFKVARAVFETLVTPASFMGRPQVCYISVTGVAELINAARGAPAERRELVLNFIVYYVQVMRERGISDTYPIVYEHVPTSTTTQQRVECLTFLQKVYVRRDRPQPLRA
jgi:hypothetical protein